MIRLDFANHGDAVHHRHGYVGDDEIWHFGARHQQSRLSVFGKQHVVVLREDGIQVLAQVFVVFHHQYGVLLTLLFSCHLFLFGHVLFQFLLSLFGFCQVSCHVLVADLSWNLVLFILGRVHLVYAAGVHQGALGILRHAFVVRQGRVVVSQNLVEHVEHLVRILQGDGKHLPSLSGDAVFRVEHLLQRASYQGERRAQLVAGVAEEVVLHQAHLVAYLLVLVAVVDVEDAAHHAHQQEHHHHFSPDALPEGRSYLDRQLSHVFAPYAVRVGAHHLEHVVAAADAVEADVVALSQFYPLAFRGKAVKAIAVFLIVFSREVEGGEADGQVSLVGRNHHFFLVQDRFRTIFAHIVQTGEDDACLVRALLHLSRVEGKAARRRAHRDVVGGWVVGRACLGKRHVEVEVVRSEHHQIFRLQVILVDTRFAHHPDVARIVFHHALHGSLIGADFFVVQKLEAVLQQVLADYVLQYAAHLGYVGLSVAVLHDEVHVASRQPCGVAIHVGGGVEFDLRRVAHVVAEGNHSVGGACQDFSRRGAEDASHLAEFLLRPWQDVLAADEVQLSRGRHLHQTESASVGAYPYSAVAVGYDVVYLIKWQRIFVGRVVHVLGHSLRGSDKESVLAGTYPYLSLRVVEDGEDGGWAECHLLRNHLSAWGKIAHLLESAVRNLDHAVVVARPVVSLGCIADGKCLRFAFVKLGKVVSVILECHLRKVVHAAYPEDALV